MSEGTNGKIKLLYLLKILAEKTDDSHAVTMEEIIASLAYNGISAERKALYRDIESLNEYGITVEREKKNKTYYYRMSSRRFKLAELKLLVDSVQAAKFITTEKSNELIRKLESLASNYEASQLQRQVYTSERVKTNNDTVINNVEAIHQAIAANRKIRYQYFNWNVKKEREFRHEGADYHISPWALCLDDENYYMVGYDSEAGKIKHYRVDKMLNIRMSDEMREGSSHFERFDIGAYAKKRFGMFDGKEEMVQIVAENYLAGVFIDRFGKDVMMRPLDKDHFKANVKAAVSNQFIYWVFALNGAKIVGPDRVREKAEAEIRRLIEQYGDIGTEKS